MPKTDSDILQKIQSIITPAAVDLSEQEFTDFFKRMQVLTSKAPKPTDHKELIIQTDGAARGNPGPAGIGVVIFDSQMNKLKEIYEYVGEVTNNVAEYEALVKALETATELGATKVTIKSDSELMTKQMRGEYRVKTPNLIPVYQKAKTLENNLTVKYEHVLRGKNKDADRLANFAIDSAKI